MTTAKRVLIVEDEETTTQIIREILQGHGHTVEVAASAAQGVARASAFRPDVVLLDLGLPDTSGLDVAEFIRSDPELKHVWLVAITGSSAEGAAAKAGFDAYFTKPIRFEELVLHLSMDLPAR
jgi:CheY-like chemotaxis protein